MNELNQNWITEGLMDFEYKKYTLLAYLKSCRHNFHESKLYPPLGNLVRHYQSLNELNNSLEQLQNSFPKEFKGFDFKKLRMEYERQKLHDEHLATITEIMEFALPSMKGVIDEGKEIYEFVESNINIEPLGVMPVYNQEGYILINAEKTQDVHVYQYQHSVISSTTEHFRSLSLNYLLKEVRSITNTFEQIKLNLISRFTDLPQPAIYLCLSKLSFPLTETLLPVAKRVMLKRLTIA